MNNQITLVGMVGGEPTSVTFNDSDNRLAKFSIAVAEYSSKVDDPEPMWIDVDAWATWQTVFLISSQKVAKSLLVGDLQSSNTTKKSMAQPSGWSDPLLNCLDSIFADLSLRLQLRLRKGLRPRNSELFDPLVAGALAPAFPLTVENST